MESSGDTSPTAWSAVASVQPADATICYKPRLASRAFRLRAGGRDAGVGGLKKIPRLTILGCPRIGVSRSWFRHTSHFCTVAEILCGSPKARRQLSSLTEKFELFRFSNKERGGKPYMGWWLSRNREWGPKARCKRDLTENRVLRLAVLTTAADTKERKRQKPKAKKAGIGCVLRTPSTNAGKGR
jgi:hypothetical protein